MSYIGLQLLQEEDDERNELEAAKGELEKVRAELKVAQALADGFLNRLCEAKALLREEYIWGESNVDRDMCPGCKFRRLNRYLPANHPAWLREPAHDCWNGRVKNFLKD